MGNAKMIEKKTDEKKNNNLGTVAKVGLTILGVGFVTGVTLVAGMDRIMKKIFVNEDWPEEEWSNDEWAEEELEN